MKRLFEEFPPVSTGMWEQKIQQDLKGADYRKKLISKTYEGFDILPYYRKENLKDIPFLKVLPGQFPWIRTQRKENNNWRIRQDIKVQSIEKANEKALDILMKGVDSVGFDFSAYKGEISEEVIERLTKNIFADIVELNYSGLSGTLTLAKILPALAKKYNRNLDKIEGEIDFDPLGDALLDGRLPQDYLQTLKEMIEATAHLPHFKTLTVKAKNFHNAGATLSQELAFALAQAVDYLDFLTDMGVSLREILPKLKFHFAVGSDYFMEIAKFRAVRYLFAQIIKAYGLSNESCKGMHIHAETSSWTLTLYDPYVNLLRSSTQALSAILAGVDSLRILHFDAVSGKENEMAERMARNQQLIMKHESYLDQVIDPAAGSYYVENLTYQLIQSAWAEFLQVQEQGGFLQAILSGSIQQQIKNSQSVKEQDLAKGKIAVLGVNRFPNRAESLDTTDISWDATTPSATDIETLSPQRAATAFEKMRHQMDVYASQNGRPKIFLIPFGNRAMRRARAQFATNFFAVAGFEIVEAAATDLSAAVKEAEKVQALACVFCSSDDAYAGLSKDTVEAVKKHSIPVIAGYPKEALQHLQSIGIEEFIHIHSDILGELWGFIRKKIDNGIIYHEFGHLLGYILSNQYQDTDLGPVRTIRFTVKRAIIESKNIYYHLNVDNIDEECLRKNTENIERTIAWFIEVILGCTLQMLYLGKSYELCFGKEDNKSGITDYNNLKNVKKYSSFYWEWSDIYMIQKEIESLIVEYDVLTLLEPIVQEYKVKINKNIICILGNSELSKLSKLIKGWIPTEMKKKYYEIIKKYADRFRLATNDKYDM